jgi:predicted permease
MNELLRRVVCVFRRRRLDEELAEEIHLHLALRRRELEARGMDPGAADREARRLFGNVTGVREETREMRSFPALDTVLQDVRFGFRLLRRAPVFAAVAITSVAIGTAATTLVFSVANAAVFSWAAMYPASDRLVMVWQTRSAEIWAPTPADFRDWRTDTRSFAGIDAYTYTNVNLTGDGLPERLLAAPTTPRLFDTLGVRPALGRSFVPDEETWGRHRRVLLSHALWRQRFGGDPDVIGRTMTLNGDVHEVIGVMPAGAWFAASHPDVWVPLAFAPDDPANQRNSHFIYVVARLQHGISLDQANADLAAVAGRLAELHASNRGLSARAVPLAAQVLGDTRQTMTAVGGAVALVLLIACANVAGLLLVRGTARERELAIRASIGAGRTRVVRQLLTETAVLAALGGVAGAALASWAAPRVVAWMPSNLPRLHETGIPLNWRILAFTTAVTSIAAFLAGVLPAFAAGRTGTAAALKESGRTGTAGRGTVRLRTLLVAAEITIALVLVTATALLARSLAELQRASLGVRDAGLLTMRIPLAQAETRATTPARTSAYLASIVERVRAVPGVTEADVTSHVPLGGGGQSKYFHVVGRPPAATLDETPTVSARQEGPRSLQAMGARLTAGRFFTADDTAASPRVAIVNATLARRFFRDESPLGKVILLEPPEQLAPPDFLEAAGGSFVRWTIIGVVDDVRYQHPAAPPESVVHIPYQQRTPQALMGWAPEFVVIHTTRDTASVAADVRASVREVAPAQPIADVRTIEAMSASSTREETVVAALLGMFSAVALFLTAVGIYGVVASAVTHRTHEIGIRVALGARPASVVWLVVQQLVRIGAIGVLAGLLTSAAFARLLSSQLYGITASDAGAFVTAPLVVAVVTILAAWVPARRAAHIDPLAALRAD